MTARLDRRAIITLLGGAAVAWPLAAKAQRSARLPTIGYLGSSTALAQSPWVAAFVRRLHELGWLEGRTVAIEYRWAEGRSERFAEIATEFTTAGRCQASFRSQHRNHRHIRQGSIKPLARGHATPQHPRINAAPLLLAERVRARLARARGEGKRLGSLQLPPHSKNESVRLWRLLEGPVSASLPNGLELTGTVQRISRPFEQEGVAL
jgi:hypothetical protein